MKESKKNATNMQEFAKMIRNDYSKAFSLKKGGSNGNDKNETTKTVSLEKNDLYYTRRVDLYRSSSPRLGLSANSKAHSTRVRNVRAEWIISGSICLSR